MKKLNSLKNNMVIIMITLFLSLFFSVNVYAEDVQMLAEGQSGDVKWKLDSTGVLILTAETENGMMEEFTGENDENAWHQYKDQIVEVKIQDGVKNISKSAFEGCANLSKVTISESVESVHVTAFQGTAYLNNLISKNKGAIRDQNILLYYNTTEPLPYALSLSYARVIADDLLVNCDISNVKSLSFGKEVKYIGYLGIVPEKINYGGSRIEWDKVQKSEKDDFSQAQLQVAKIGKPSLTVTDSKEGVLVEWTSVYGAEQYRIYRKKNSGSSVLVKTIKDPNVTSYLDTKPQEGIYEYTIWADGCGAHNSSSTKKVVRMSSTKPILSVSNGTNAIVLSWKTVEPSTGSRVERKVGNGQWEKITLQKNGNKSSQVDKNVKFGTTYSYRICMVYEDMKGPYSEVVTIKRLACSKEQGIENVSNGIKIKWKKSAGAAGYYVYRKVSGGSAKLITTIKNVNTLSYVDKNVSFGKFYTYRVLAYSGKHTCMKDDHEWTVGIRRVDKPKSLTLKNTKSGVSLKWSKVRYAEGYRVYRKVSGGSWKLLTLIKKENIVTYVDKTAKNGKKYSYKVETLYGTVSPVKIITCKK